MARDHIHRVSESASANWRDGHQDPLKDQNVSEAILDSHTFERPDRWSYPLVYASHWRCAMPLAQEPLAQAVV